MGSKQKRLEGITGQTREQNMMTEHDTDADGKIDFGELDSFIDHDDPKDSEIVLAAFKAADTDGDESLSLEEIPPFLQAIGPIEERENEL